MSYRTNKITSLIDLKWSVCETDLHTVVLISVNARSASSRLSPTDWTVTWPAGDPEASVRWSSSVGYRLSSLMLEISGPALCLQKDKGSWKQKNHKQQLIFNIYYLHQYKHKTLIIAICHTYTCTPSWCLLTPQCKLFLTWSAALKHHRWEPWAGHVFPLNWLCRWNKSINTF